MIIATGTLNIDENAKLAQQASDDAKNAANSAADEAGKIKTSLDGKITVSSQEPFDDGKAHDEGDIWYVQDSNHMTSEMYTYDGSDWVKTKMSQTVLSVGQLSALTADLGTIEAGYLNSVEIDSSTIKAANIDAKSTITGASITGASIEEDSNNGRITLDKGGFCAIHNGKYLQFVSGNSNGYTQIRGGLDIDSINVGASVIKGQTFSAYGGNNTHIGSENAWTYLAERIKCGSTDSGHPSISSTIGTDIYFHNEAGSTIDIHAGDVISHGTDLLKEINSKTDSSGDVSRIDGDISRIRSEISDIKSELKRKKNK
ncbi:hypothetical protein QUF07_04210 [Lentilactobacillus sp. TOM.63]|uniref:hypothetical protein n=1 Tax=Lentilactobacillus sp. TOM.63 TaxID=3055077 RepID=UPI0025A27712|nr:hypothetical protein [Lentilactobacillus sp. TOM.63]MDM7515910.1 hypothetical protein [Lentilactobacillus sp. TOM.63]